jgi:hypothetical protein
LPPASLPSVRFAFKHGPSAIDPPSSQILFLGYRVERRTLASHPDLVAVVETSTCRHRCGRSVSRAAPISTASPGRRTRPNVATHILYPPVFRVKPATRGAIYATRNHGIRQSRPAGMAQWVASCHVTSIRVRLATPRRKRAAAARRHWHRVPEGGSSEGRLWYYGREDTFRGRPDRPGPQDRHTPPGGRIHSCLHGTSLAPVHTYHPPTDRTRPQSRAGLSGARVSRH